MDSRWSWRSAAGRAPAALVWLGLAVAITAVYFGLWDHRFVNFDDPMFLTENTHVTAGLTAKSIRWAWTNKDALLWQPLAWMGHMTVSEFWGMQPMPHLLANLALHSLNAGLIFVLLRSLTGAAGRSFAVALLFAVHPTNVETVAWASQLKSTLSTAFFLCALLAYAASARRGERLSIVALLAISLSLLAKPMLVLFPALLVVFEYWPMRSTPGLGRMADWWRWLAPKLPYVAVAGCAVAMTAIPWGAPVATDMDAVRAPGWQRLAAVPCNYFSYLRLLVWPTRLAVLYPEDLGHSAAEIAGTTLLLLGLSGLAWQTRRRLPAFLAGWSWFVITLLPASGIIRPGQHAVADHYFYVPGIGLLIAVVWLVAEIPVASQSLVRPTGLGVAALALGWLAQTQSRYWESSLSLWQHAAAVTAPSAVCHINLGNALMESGQELAAAAEFSAAAAMAPNDFRPYVDLAVIAHRQGDLAGAIRIMRQAYSLAPNDARILSNLGSWLQDAGDAEGARRLLRRAVAIRPDLPEAQINLGVFLAQSGELREALTCFRTAAALRPADPGIQQNLRLVLQQLAAEKQP